MALVRVPGGFWVPDLGPIRFASNSTVQTNETGTLDADEEELQIIGYVCLAAGSGSKTFGTSGSKVSWLPGASITFAAGSTVRVGVKKASTIDNANGPAGRATIGAAAFDVYDDLVGGTDTITSTTYRSDTMTAGTGFTVAQGDKLAVCFHLDTSSGTPSVKIRGQTTAGNNPNIPCVTLVTSGPTYNTTPDMPNVILTFDDGTIGWLDGSFIFSADTGDDTVGNTNLYGNIIQLPFECKVDAVRCLATLGVGTTNGTIGFWSSPLGTIAAVANGTVTFDPQNMNSTGQRMATFALPAEITLAANTPYALAIKQDSASDFRFSHYDVSAASHFQANGLDSNSYAAKSTAGGSFSAQNSGKRRMGIWARISQVHDGTSSGGGGPLIGGRLIT